MWHRTKKNGVHFIGGKLFGFEVLFCTKQWIGLGRIIVQADAAFQEGKFFGLLGVTGIKWRMKL